MLLTCVAIGIIAAIITGWFLYQNRMEFWKTQARSTFRVALGEELQKRNMEIPFYVEENIDLSIMDANDRKKELIKVSMISKYGEKSFIIPYEKHIHNIERPSDWRLIRSIVLEDHPLIADSLNLLWKELLGQIEYPGKTVVRISVTDWWEHEACSYSEDSLYLSKSDSLDTHYLGYRCEVGVTGYLYGPWWMIFSWKDMFLLGALIVCCTLLYFVHDYMLKNGDLCLKLTPLSAKLLRGFLDAKDFKLSNDEILNLLWPDGNGTLNNLHTNIKRLRGYLSRISNYKIENKNFSYQLKNPHFIEEIPE